MKDKMIELFLCSLLARNLSKGIKEKGKRKKEKGKRKKEKGNGKITLILREQISSSPQV